jgi:hypothetical protein
VILKKQPIEPATPAPAQNNFCNLLGHRWRYKDYTNSIKPNGEKFEFSASRFCSRCREHGYLYDEWKSESKSALDYLNDCYATKTP